MEVDGTSWPNNPPRGWACENGVLKRYIEGESKRSGSVPAVPAEMEELMLRFPSAPIHGVQRLHEHHVSLGDSENFHSFRILRSADSKALEKPVTRIYLMHCGLNELRHMGLYYRLASRLIKLRPTSVCLIRPFPGHLTRYPFQAFAETPLDNYLWDGSHLFRQFLRFMVETQWLLSALVRRSSYRCASGANLLAESDDISSSRLETPRLAKVMHGDWMRLYSASATTAQREADEGSQTNRSGLAVPPSEDQFVEVIETLRDVLNLDVFEKRNGELKPREKNGEPKLHVLGYSLGGFMAQSVFMSWPFLIASCSTLLAGGALKELAPIGFTDPEEWQTVLHSLRYELDDRLMSPKLGVEEDAVAGISRDLFTYFKRTFYEVFQQEYRGGIQTRYEAYRDRMLFVVGGDDPVVRPESVLQSGPKGGLNLLEIGGLSHFFDEDGDDPASRNQRTFWLPEMATLIDGVARSAGEEQDRQRPCTWFDAAMEHPMLSRHEWDRTYFSTGTLREEDPVVRPLSPNEEIEIGPEGGLSEEMFERCLDDLLYRTWHDEDGILFTLRNEVPTLLQPPQAVRETAAALYHDDLSITRYCHGIAARREMLEECIERTCLVLPWNAGSIMRHLDQQRAYPSQAESAGGQVKERADADEIWRESLAGLYKLVGKKSKRPSIRVYDGRRPAEVNGEALETVLHHGKAFMRESYSSVPSLPDCWVWISKAAVTGIWGKLKMKVNPGIDGLVRLARDVGHDDEATLSAIQKGAIRIVDVSRARYNPRYRGRLLVDGRSARRRLLHVAICLALSQPIIDSRNKRLLS